MSLPQLRNLSPNRVQARTFFEHVCPVLLEQRSNLCRELGGRYSFTLTGAGGGTWTIDFSLLQIERSAIGADLAIRMTASDFEALLDGSLDAGAAIECGDLAFAGNGDLFENLAAFTSPDLGG